MRKNNVVQIRVEDEEKQRWGVLAEAMGVSLSDWIRGRCNGAGERADAAMVAVSAKMRAIPDVGRPEPRLPGAVDKPTLPLGGRCSRHKVVNCGRCGG